MPIYELTKERVTPLTEVTFAAAHVRERDDLQRVLRDKVEVIAPDTLVVAEEFGEWEDSRRRIDLLGVHKSGDLVVVELKRTEDGGHMELQALRYAAMISTMTFDRVVLVYAEHLAQTGGDAVQAQARLLEFLGWEAPDEASFAQDVRVVLAAAEFSRELTTAVMWLNERQLDIRCVRLKPYRLGERLLLDVQQVIPLPEVAEYQVRIRDKERRGREERSDRSNLLREFWTALLARARAKTQLHAAIAPSDVHWVAVASGVRGVAYNYVATQTEMRVELYIDRGDWGAAYNRAVFDLLRERRAAIETAYGGPLRWDQVDGRRACRVAATTEGGYRDPENRWAAVHDSAIDAMTRLERAMKPHLPDVGRLRPS